MHHQPLTHSTHFPLAPKTSALLFLASNQSAHTELTSCVSFPPMTFLSTPSKQMCVFQMSSSVILTDSDLTTSSTTIFLSQELILCLPFSKCHTCVSSKSSLSGGVVGTLPSSSNKVLQWKNLNLFDHLFSSWCLLDSSLSDPTIWPSWPWPVCMWAQSWSQFLQSCNVWSCIQWSHGHSEKLDSFWCWLISFSEFIFWFLIMQIHKFSFTGCTCLWLQVFFALPCFFVCVSSLLIQSIMNLIFFPFLPIHVSASSILSLNSTLYTISFSNKSINPLIHPMLIKLLLSKSFPLTIFMWTSHLLFKCLCFLLLLDLFPCSIFHWSLSQHPQDFFMLIWSCTHFIWWIRCQWDSV